MSEQTFIPPASVAAAARKGLEMRRKFKRGGTSVGAARAGQLSNRNPVSLSTVRRIKAYFDRHQVDKKGKDWGNESNPSAGFVAWYLWGADSSWSWAKGILAKHDKKSVKEHVAAEMAVVLEDATEELFGSDIITEEYIEPVDNKAERISRANGLSALKMAIRIAFASSEAMQKEITKKLVDSNFKASGGFIDETKNIKRADRVVYNQKCLEILEKPSDELTPEDIETLRMYSGWGALEVDGERGAQYDFFSLPSVAKAQVQLMNMLRPLKAGDRVLEPSCGNGVFFMPEVMPDGLEKIGVEIDARAAGVASRLTEGKAEIRNQPFELYNLENNEPVDFVIGNAPFGNRQAELRTKDDPEEKNLDRYFLKKCMLQLKAGGYMCIQVHNGVFNNKTNKKWRLDLMLLGKFMGALRLPNGAYEHAGSGFAAPDVLIFQRHEEPFKKALEMVMRKSNVTWETAAALAKSSSHLNEEQKIALLTAAGLYNEYWHEGGEKYYKRRPTHMMGEEVQLGFLKTTKGEIKADILDGVVGTFRWETYGPPMKEAIPPELMNEVEAEEKEEAEQENRISLTNEEVRHKFSRVLRDGDTKVVDGKIYILASNEFGRSSWELMKVPNVKPKVLSTKVGAAQIISEQVRDLRTKLYANDPSCSEIQKAVIGSLKKYQTDYGVALFEDEDILKAYTKYPMLNGVSEALTLQTSKKDDEAGTDDKFAHVLTASVEPEDLDDDFNGHRPEIAFLMKYRDRYVEGMTEDVVVDLLGPEKGAEMLDLLFKSSFVAGIITPNGLPVFQLKETYLNGRVSVLEKQAMEAQAKAPNEQWKQKFEQTQQILEDSRQRANFDDIDVKLTSNFVSDDLIQDYINETINDGGMRDALGANPDYEFALRVLPLTDEYFKYLKSQRRSRWSYENYRDIFDKAESFSQLFANIDELHNVSSEDWGDNAEHVDGRNAFQALLGDGERQKGSVELKKRIYAVQVEIQTGTEDRSSDDPTVFDPKPLKTTYRREFVLRKKSRKDHINENRGLIADAIDSGKIPAGTYLSDEEFLNHIKEKRPLPTDFAGVIYTAYAYGSIALNHDFSLRHEQPFSTKKDGEAAVQTLRNYTRRLNGAQPMGGDQESRQQFVKDFDSNFEDWINARREQQIRVERAFDEMNNDYLKSSKLDYPIEIKGWNSNIRLRGVQWQSIHHMLRNQRGIAALGVGFGKTLAAVGLTGVLLQEKKATRVWVQVPNNKVADWQQEYGMGLPSLNVMAASPEIAKDRSLKFRFYQQMASSGASVLILPESMATEVQLSPQEDVSISERLFEDQSRFVTAGSVKEREGFKNKIRGILDTSEARQAPIPFEAFGCDAIITDELHQMKNLFPPYKASVSGISQLTTVKDSIRGISLLKKYEYLRKSNPAKGMGANTYGLTATPMTNSPLEFWNMLYHVNSEALRENRIDDLGTFVRQFCIIKNELAPNSTGERMVPRPTLKGFRNLDVLRKVFFEVVDYQVNRAALEKDAEYEFFKDNKGVTFTEGGDSYEVISSTKGGDGAKVTFKVNGAEELVLTTGDVDQRNRLRQLMAELRTKTGGKKTEAGRKAIYHDVEVPPSPMLQDVIADLRKQYETLSEEEAEEDDFDKDGVDLDDEGKEQEVDQKSQAVRRAQLWRDMQTASLDLEMLDPETHKDAPNNKLNKCVENVMKHWNESKSGQLIFCDRINASRGRGGGLYNLHNKLKQLLVEAGFPQSKIGIINGGAKNAEAGGTTNAKEASYIDKTGRAYNDGTLRILIGNTPCMGEGLNLQADSIAVHHLDVPYRPSDLVQRNGRVDRQGNKQMTTHIYNYTTAGTLDAYSVAEIKRKANWMQDMLESDQTIFEQPDLNAMANDPISISLLLAESAGDEEGIAYWSKRKRIMLDEIQRVTQVEEAQTNFKAYVVQMQSLLRAEAGSDEYINTMKRVNKYRKILSENPQFQMNHLIQEDTEPFLMALPPKEFRSVGSTLDVPIIRIGDWFVISSEPVRVENNELVSNVWQVDSVAISTGKVWVTSPYLFEPKKDPEDENEELRPQRRYFYVDFKQEEKDNSAKKIRYSQLKKIPRGLEPDDIEDLLEIDVTDLSELPAELQRKALMARGMQIDINGTSGGWRATHGEPERKKELYDPIFDMVPAEKKYQQQLGTSAHLDRWERYQAQKGEKVEKKYREVYYMLAPMADMAGIYNNQVYGPLGEQYKAKLPMSEYVLKTIAREKENYSDKISLNEDSVRTFEEYVLNTSWWDRGHQQKMLGGVFGITPQEVNDMIVKEVQRLGSQRLFVLNLDDNEYVRGASEGDPSVAEKFPFHHELLKLTDWQDAILEQFELIMRIYGEKIMAKPLMTNIGQDGPSERPKEENTEAHRYYQILYSTLHARGGGSKSLIERWRIKNLPNHSDYEQAKKFSIENSEPNFKFF